MPDFDAIVLAGGAAKRLGGLDKPMQQVDGVPMLIRVLAAIAGARRRVVVGPPREIGIEVTWTREDPPGSGPVAAVAAGLTLTSAEFVLVLAADLPWIAPAVTPLLRAAEQDMPAVVLRTQGRVNYLAAAWRRDVLAASLGRLPEVAGAPMRRLYDGVAFGELADEAGWGRDCDTWADLGLPHRRTRRDE